mgnify:CR=1 FL=1
MYHNNFKSFGFSAQFNGGILAKVHTFYIGFITLPITPNGFTPIYAARWNADGIEFANELGDNGEYDLTRQQILTT